MSTLVLLSQNYSGHAPSNRHVDQLLSGKVGKGEEGDDAGNANQQKVSEL
jgi:hypothetical protein